MVGLSTDGEMLELKANEFGFVVLEDPASATSIPERGLIRRTYGLLGG